MHHWLKRTITQKKKKPKIRTDAGDDDKVIEFRPSFDILLT